MRPPTCPAWRTSGSTSRPPWSPPDSRQPAPAATAWQGCGTRPCRTSDHHLAGRRTTDGGGDGGPPEARPAGPIIYTFLPSQATRYNSDLPSFPSVLCESMSLSSWVYLAMQALGWCTGRSGRGTAVSDPKDLENHQRIHRKYWLKCLDLQKLPVSWHFPFKR